jgi:hypothetical protein
VRAMWSLHRFTRSRRTSDCALHTMMHEVPAHNVMRHDTADFPPLLPMAAHSLTQSTHKSRSAAECPETSRRRCWKLSLGCWSRQDGTSVIASSVGLRKPCHTDWSLYCTLACQMQMARVYAPPNLHAPPNYPVPTGPRPTEMIL